MIVNFIKKVKNEERGAFLNITLSYEIAHNLVNIIRISKFHIINRNFKNVQKMCKI